METEPYVILVDESDNQIGTERKMAAHKNGGKLHRAFSIFVFNSRGELLLQQRAKQKYHAPLMWANTCCSHPRPGESILEAAHRRLKEELGFDCPLEEKFSFTYREPVGNGLTEWEFDHVIFGHYDGPVIPNQDEVESVKWITLDELKRELTADPEKYAPWLRICIDRVIREFESSP